MSQHELTAYQVWPNDGWAIVPAPKERAWMNATPGRFAYRCLPLTMANHAGWAVLCPASFTVIWDGRPEPEGSLRITFHDEGSKRFESSIRSHFGSGILTFSIPYLFRTPPGVGLAVRGLPNCPKFNAYPFDGIVETDWSSSTFTMNWKIQQPNIAVRWEPGECVCFLQPTDLSLIEKMTARIARLDSNPELAGKYERWSASRSGFINDPNRGGAWQKDYTRGRDIDDVAAAQHRTNVQVRGFERASDAGQAPGPGIAEAP